MQTQRKIEEQCEAYEHPERGTEAAEGIIFASLLCAVFYFVIFRCFFN